MQNRRSNMFDIVAIVGLKNSGKTTLISNIIKVLSTKGYKIGVLKHDVHSFDIDHPNTDTYKIRKAGAYEIAISNKEMFAYIKSLSYELKVSKIAMEYFKDIDLLILEGYKSSHYPKIEIVKGKPILHSDDNVIAYISYNFNITTSLPIFNIDDIVKISSFIEDNFLKKTDDEKMVELYVNDKKIPIKSFVSKTIINTIRGLLSPLKYCDNPNDILIRIKK